MTLSDWQSLALEIKENFAPLPHIMLWGGEPLVCPFFDELVIFLKEQGFTLGMVTNGVLLDKHMEICRSAFKTIYVSIDGPRDIHNSIRGQGVFERVSNNLKMLAQSDAHIVVMSVLSPILLNELSGFPELIAEFGADELYLQDYIVLSEDETKQYSKWMKKSFDIDATEIKSWTGELPKSYEEQKETAICELSKKEFSIPVKHISHKADGCLCQSPYKHIHVSWNGNVMYCTDFYDFSAGNVKNEKLIKIFNNDISEKFRLELDENPTCRHCSWRNNDTFRI